MTRSIRSALLGAVAAMLPLTALASAPPPVSVSEPGMFSLLGAGVVGAIVVARFLRKK